MPRTRNHGSLLGGFLRSTCLVGVGMMASCTLTEAPSNPSPGPTETENLGSVEQADSYTGKGLVNQFGYLTNATKIGLVVYAADTATTSWELRKVVDNTVQASGTTAKITGTDQGDYLHKIDFSSFTTVAT